MRLIILVQDGVSLLQDVLFTFPSMIEYDFASMDALLLNTAVTRL